MSYLIAHKVSGEPAFDVADRMACPICKGVGAAGNDPEDAYEGPACDECDGLGYWWIVGTSGHRAYPYWWTELSMAGSVLYFSGGDEEGTVSVPNMPSDCPDHYPEPSARREAKTAPSTILARLGLVAKPEPIKRRV